MKVKLTLTVEQEAILRMKRLAKARRTSVSALVEQWSSRSEGDPDTRQSLGERLRGKWPEVEGGDSRLDHLLEKHGG